MYEALIITRNTGTGADSDAYRPQFIEEYAVGWEDVTARLNAEQALAPRLVVLQVRASDAVVAAMQGDTRLNVIGWTRYSDDEERTVLNTNWDNVLTAVQRTAVTDWLVNLGADRTKVESRIVAGVTRRQVATGLRNYLRTRT